MSQVRKRVLIADDHPLILAGVRDLLSPHFDVVDVVTDGREAVIAAKRLMPDVIVLDIHMPVLNGMEAARQIRAALPGAHIIFLTQQLNPDYVQAGFRAGAMGFVAKQAAPAELLDAIRAVLQKRYFVTPLATNLTPQLLSIHNPKLNPADLFGSQLTPRQREVLQLVAEGRSNREIATGLGISTKTVEFHKSTLMDELGLRTTAELTRYAIAHGIVAA